MTDFDYDVRQKKIIAQSASKKHHTPKGCTLPSDYLTKAQLKELDKGTRIVNLDMDKPLKWAVFKTLVEEQQEEYLRHLMDNYHVTDKELSEMFGVSRGTISIVRKNLHIKGAPKTGRIPISSDWKKFVTKDSEVEPAVVEEVLNSVFELQSKKSYESNIGTIRTSIVFTAGTWDEAVNYLKSLGYQFNGEIRVTMGLEVM